MDPSASPGLVISPDRLVRYMLTCIAILIVASCAGQFAKYFLGHDHLFGLVRLTYLNGEATIPSWYASSTLLICALTLAVVGAVRRAGGDRHAIYWMGLAAIFTYLSLDEGAAIHELWGEPIEARFAPGGFLAFAWVIPAAAIVLAVGLTYLRFVWTLPAVTRWLFVLAGAVYVGSAMGVEMLGAKYVALESSRTFTYSLLVTLEETGEMLGITIFLYAVLRFLASDCGVIRLEVRMPDATLAAPETARQLPGPIGPSLPADTRLPA